MAHEFEKEQVAKEAIKLVQDETVIGIGTGSSVQPFIRLLLEKVEKEALNIKCICTSLASQRLLHGKIPLINSALGQYIDITFDGADEIDTDFNLIKGGGGALLREKIVAFQSKQNIVLVDESKLVAELHKHPLPLEIITFGYKASIKRIQKLGFKGSLRMTGSNLFALSDNDNLLFDIELEEPITDPQATHDKLKGILGVVETGLFIKTAKKALIGKSDGSVTVREA
jgi:ribose 5-phosphate isomerase A